ncbi:ABC transporter permease, partial [Rhizobium ruizarguesonis]
LGVPEWIRFVFLGAGGALILVVLLLQRIAEGRILPVLFSLAVGVALYAGIPHFSLDLDWPPSIFLGLIAAIGLVLAAPLPHAFLS